MIGHATNIITGLAVSLQAAVLPVSVIAGGHVDRLLRGLDCLDLSDWHRRRVEALLTDLSQS